MTPLSTCTFYILFQYPEGYVNEETEDAPKITECNDDDKQVINVKEEDDIEKSITETVTIESEVIKRPKRRKTSQTKLYVEDSCKDKGKKRMDKVQETTKRKAAKGKSYCGERGKKRKIALGIESGTRAYQHFIIYMYI